MDSTARELGNRLYDLLKVVRMIKQRRVEVRPSVPLGLVGMLMQIDQLSAGSHARELATRTGLDPSTVSRAVTTLTAHGLVRRRTDPTDRRANCLWLTDAGRDALTSANDWYARLVEDALTDWTPDEIAALHAGLRRFTRGIEAALAAHDTLESAQ
ncbi:MarR family winged helix-turn-helix transcriptional regulator [Solwaraspora sp. WMMB335]|uniref:MarR family winged helix-turn-helix transcriptional regulator n=1 Tax=Solwaraspora sp. WMMB335 TaxID=3404118 RepID=UPI003B955737